MRRDRPPHGFGRHELGILVPIVAESAKPPLPDAGVYPTYRELSGGETLGQSDVVEALRKLSAADCLWAIANINTQLFVETGPDTSAQFQRRLMAEVIGDRDLGRRLMRGLPRRCSLSSSWCISRVWSFFMRTAGRRTISMVGDCGMSGRSV